LYRVGVHLCSSCSSCFPLPPTPLWVKFLRLGPSLDLRSHHRSTSMPSISSSKLPSWGPSNQRQLRRFSSNFGEKIDVSITATPSPFYPTRHIHFGELPHRFPFFPDLIAPCSPSPMSDEADGVFCPCSPSCSSSLLHCHHGRP
jgi:hypothetical protein